MEKLANVVRLMAKTGLFFANCDGQYAQPEKDFIHGFIAQIEQVGTIDEELKREVTGAIDRKYTLEESFATRRKCSKASTAMNRKPFS